MAFLKFGGKDLVGVNRKKLKSITYNGKTYNFDLASGGDVALTIENNIKNTEVYCYRIPKDVVFDVVRISTSEFAKYMEAAIAVDESLALFSNMSPFVGVNAAENPYLQILGLFTGMLAQYLGFRLMPDTDDSMPLIHYMSTYYMWRPADGQDRAIVLPKSVDEFDSLECDPDMIAKMKKSIHFYSISTEEYYNQLAEHLDEANAAIDAFDSNGMNELVHFNHGHITDFESYLSYLRMANEFVANELPKIDTIYGIEGAYDIEIISAIVSAIYGAIGMSGDHIIQTIRMCFMKKGVSFEMINDKFTKNYGKEALSDIFSAWIDSIRLVFGMNIVDIQGDIDNFGAMTANDQESTVVNCSLLNTVDLVEANYYYGKKYEPIMEMTTARISKNLIASNIFFSQTLDESEKVPMGEIEVNLDNLFSTPVDTNEYNYISRYRDLRINRISFDGALAFRKASFDDMPSHIKMAIPEGTKAVSVKLNDTSDFDSAPQIKTTGPTMFAASDTTHSLGGTTVPEWKGYYTREIIGNEYVEYSKRQIYTVSNTSANCIVDPNSATVETSNQSMAGYTRIYYNESLGENYSVSPESVSCLAGDTMITMADGSERRLDSIKEGDSILTLKNGKFVPSEVAYCDSDMVKEGRGTRYYFSHIDVNTYVDVVRDHRFSTGRKLSHISGLSIGETVMGIDGHHYTLIRKEELGTISHYTIFAKNACPYIANGLVSGNIFCNIRPKFLARIAQRVYLGFVRKSERKGK